PVAVVPVVHGPMPSARFIDSVTGVGPAAWERSLQIFRQSREKPPIVADDEPAAGSGGVAVTVRVAVEEPLHHFSGRRDDLREFERLRLAPRTVLRNTEPAAKLLANRARYRSYSQHRNIPLQKTRGNCHSFDRGL